MRRNTLRAVAAALVMLTLAAAFGSDLALAQKRQSAVFFAMDTRVSVTVYGVNAGDALVAAQKRLEQLESLWSVTDPGSEIYAINHGDGIPVAVSGETADILAFALDVACATGGAFEPTIYPVLSAWGFTTDEYRIPSEQQLALLLASVGYQKVALDGESVAVPKGTQIDLGAVAKGRAADLAAAAMRESGAGAALIDLGGNILAFGTKPDGTPWRIAIKDPAGGGNIGLAELESGSVVTSGGYERYFTAPDGQVYIHIIDPSTGKPADSGLLSATVIGAQSAVCDALSTAIFVMGLQRAEEFWREYGDFEMILIADDGTIHITEGIARSFSLSENHKNADLRVITR